MTNTDKQCPSCGGFCGKVCERENVVEPYNGWILRNVYFEDGEPLMHSEPESQELAEPETATLTPQEIYALSKQSGINFACDSEGGWSGLTDDEISNRYTGKPHPEDEHAIKRTIEILKPFAKAIESRTLTKQKAKWYQIGVEAERHDISKMVENYCGALDDQGQTLIQKIRARGENNE